MTHDNRYRHKLNMLNPQMKLIKWIGILLLVGLILLLLKLNTAAYIVFGLAVLLDVALVILVAVKARRNRALNELALQEKTDRNAGSIP